MALPFPRWVLCVEVHGEMYRAFPLRRTWTRKGMLKLATRWNANREYYQVEGGWRYYGRHERDLPAWTNDMHTSRRP